MACSSAGGCSNSVTAGASVDFAVADNIEPLVLPTGPELEEARAQIRVLRKSALKADFKSHPDFRRATPLEIAVSDADRLPHQCVAHSRRHGLACTRNRNLGTTVCPKHGGSFKAVKRTAKRKLMEELMPTLARVAELRDQSDHLPTALAAAKEMLSKVLPALRREEKKSTKESSAPRISIGVVLGGVNPALPPPTVTAMIEKPKAALPAAIVEDEE